MTRRKNSKAQQADLVVKDTVLMLHQKTGKRLVHNEAICNVFERRTGGYHAVYQGKGRHAQSFEVDEAVNFYFMCFNMLTIILQNE